MKASRPLVAAIALCTALSFSPMAFGQESGQASPIPPTAPNGQAAQKAPHELQDNTPNQDGTPNPMGTPLKSAGAPNGSYSPDGSNIPKTPKAKAQAARASDIGGKHKSKDQKETMKTRSADANSNPTD